MQLTSREQGCYHSVSRGTGSVACDTPHLWALLLLEGNKVLKGIILG